MSLSALQPFTDVLIALATGVLLAVLIGWLWHRYAVRRRIARVTVELTEQFQMEFGSLNSELEQNHHLIEESHRRIEEGQQQLAESQQRIEESRHQASLASQRAQRSEEQVIELQSRLDVEQEQRRTALAESSASAARLEALQAGIADKDEAMKAARNELRREFELVSARLFEQNGERFAARSNEQINALLKPFREQIGEFKQRVETVHLEDVKGRESILSEVRALQSASAKINEEAANLTQALKGDSKVQGSWGEMVLERVLEQSGLTRGREYLVQASFRDGGGSQKRPDVIIRLPESKDVVVDAKVSLTAYERAISADDDAERERHLGEHLASLKAHVKRLANQGYEDLADVRSLDFVLLFVPIESAFTLALEAEPEFFNQAFEQRIVIVSPTTLMLTLRIIANVWRYENQSKNAQEIADRASKLYDKVRLVVDELGTLKRHLDNAQGSFDTVSSRLSSGRGNVVKQVESFRALGARVKEPMPQSVLDSLDDDDEEPASLDAPDIDSSPDKADD